MPDRHAPRPFRSLAIAATAGLLALVVGAGAVSAAATTTRVSISTQGVEGDDDAHYPTISGDGRWVAFASSAANLVNNDTNSNLDVFIYDRKTRGIRRVSIRTNKSQSDRGSGSPAISADGRWVAFDSWGPLVAADTNDDDDIYVRGPLH